MKLFINAYDFHRFDGEGSADGMSAEASNFLASLGGNGYGRVEDKSDTSTIEYGRAEDHVETQQVGTATNEAQSLEERFAEMTKKGGEFHDIYGKAVAQAIQDRFKNQADQRGQLDQMQNAVAPLVQKYGLDPSDIEGLTQAIASDADIFRSGAEEAGLDVGQYMERLKLESDAARGRQIMEAYQEQQRRNQMFAQWDSEAAQLKEAFPSFDLGMELEQNQRFAQMLDGGATVTEAFAATHMYDILNGYNNESKRNAQAEVVSQIQRQANRPMESGMKPAPAVQRKVDPSKFTDADIDEILKRVNNGERFSF